MTPQQLALSQLQAASTVGSFPLGPSQAGENGHAGPNASSEAVYQASLQQAPPPEAPQQETTGSIDYIQLEKHGYSPTQIEGFLSDNPGITLKHAPANWDAAIMQPTIIPSAAPLTETFGEIQPKVEVFSHGVTTGTGIGVKSGTPLATPPGKWKVVNSYDQAPKKGFIGNGAGNGWGNNVVVQNQDTGESLRYSHLSQVQVAKGDTILGTRVIGLSGQSGNTTGDHLNLQYITPEGKPADVLQSQYARYLPIKR